MQEELVHVEHGWEKAVGWGRDCAASMEQLRVGKEGLFCFMGDEDEQPGEKGTTPACRGPEQGGTS